VPNPVCKRWRVTCLHSRTAPLPSRWFWRKQRKGQPSGKDLDYCLGLASRTLRLHYPSSKFLSEYSMSHWQDLLRKELPELTAEDIEWLCGLSEAAEALEPVQSMGPGNFVKPAQKAPPSKRRRGGNGTATGHALGSPEDALPQATSLDGTGTGRKRKSVALSVPSRRSPRLQLESEQSLMAPSVLVGARNPRPESDGSRILKLGSHHRLRN
jgi:hypothetical protein